MPGARRSFDKFSIDVQRQQSKSLNYSPVNLFHTLLPHLTRAVRISRQLWQEKFKHAVATEQLET